MQFGNLGGASGEETGVETKRVEERPRIKSRW